MHCTAKLAPHLSSPHLAQFCIRVPDAHPLCGFLPNADPITFSLSLSLYEYESLVCARIDLFLIFLLFLLLLLLFFDSSSSYSISILARFFRNQFLMVTVSPQRTTALRLVNSSPTQAVIFTLNTHTLLNIYRNWLLCYTTCFFYMVGQR